MAKLYRELDSRLEAYIKAQPSFFVASAPINCDGLINISPRGTATLKVLDANTVAYLDLSGGGIESIGHIKENGRLAMMFCGAQGNVLRLHGHAQAIERYHAQWSHLASNFSCLEGARAIIVLSITRISDSGGPPPVRSLEDSEPRQSFVPRGKRSSGTAVLA